MGYIREEWYNSINAAVNEIKTMLIAFIKFPTGE